MENYIKLALDDSLGSLLLATILNGMLWSQEVTLTVRYFLKRRPDPWFVKLGLAVLFLNDTLSVASQIYCVYTYLVTNWGNIAYLSYQYWPIVYFCIGTGISAFICQSFLIYRVWRLTKNLPAVIVLFLCTLAAAGGAIWAGAEQVIHKLYSERSAGDRAVTTWLVASAVCDLGIMVCLLWFLIRARNEASRFSGSQLEKPLNRMIRMTIETGGWTCCWAIVALIVYLHDSSSNSSVAMGFMLGRWYALTMLFCLFQRGQADHKANSQTGSCATCGNAPARHRVLGLATSMATGVQVQSIQAVTVERGDDHELDRLGGRSRSGASRTLVQSPPRINVDDTSEEEDKDELEKVGGGHNLV